MFSRSARTPLSERTVGVVERKEGLCQPGLNLMSVGRETYLFDEDGRVVHEWTSDRVVFCSYLLPNGNLLRDGSENIIAVGFRTGGAAGFIEEVTWEGERVWSFNHYPIASYLTHHALCPLPNGNILMLSWERKTKEEAIKAGRRPELIPDGEVWDNLVVELRPNGSGGADIVWKWSVWDHLIQDYDPSKDNYGVVADHPERYDINFCPPLGKAGSRDQTFLKQGNENKSSVFGKPATGERDWLHVNSVSYDEQRDQIILSFNVPSEIIVIDHSTTMEESASESGGKSGKGGSILYRWGNPQAYRMGSRLDQRLFCQHSVHFIRNVPGDGNIILFNNGRYPDRHWSTVDELVLPETYHNSGEYVYNGQCKGLQPYGPSEPVWSYGDRVGRKDSFYCTHISSCQRLSNGNTLITQGPQGIVFEVTPHGEEVWRYISPVVSHVEGSGSAVCFLRQGDTNLSDIGRRSLFIVQRYDLDYAAFVGREIVPLRYLEA